MYRTGDVVRWTAGGNIEYLGRRDRQVRIRGVRVELGEIDAVLREFSGVGEAAVVVQQRAGTPLLAAYVTDRRREDPANVAALRAALERRLPTSMIPTTIVRLERLPRLPSGKVDLCALIDAGGADVAGRPYREPATSLERGLARVWSAVLGVPAVGADDNFFELGGDSILAIRVVARIRSELRVRLTASQLLAHQTVSALARLVRPADEEADVAVEGPLPLTPIQRWFFQHLPDPPGHYSQCVLLELHRRFSASAIEHVATRLVAHHDALRSRFDRGANGWQARTVPTTSAPAPTTVVDLSRLPASSHAIAIEACGAALQRALSPSDGPMIRLALFDRGAGLAPRLLTTLHHLVTDAISWAILLEDLGAGLSSVANGATIDLPSKTASYQQWARSLTEHVRAGGALDEIDFWLRLLDRPYPPVPVDFEEGPNSEASVRVVSAVLTPEMTARCLAAAATRRRGGRHEVVLAALARAVANFTATRTVCLELEGHGRERVGDDLDVSRTVGWFSSLYPVMLELGTSTDPWHELDAVSAQLRGIPRAGIGYGLLRYLSADPRAARLAALRRPEISFEYLGTLDSLVGPGPVFTAVHDPCGPRCDGRAERRYLLEVTAFVASGRLHVHIGYSANRHGAATVQRFMDDFLGCLTAYGSPREPRYTPDDFPDVDLTQDQLDLLVSRFAPVGSAPQ